MRMHTTILNHGSSTVPSGGPKDENGQRPYPELTDMCFSSPDSPLPPIVRLGMLFLKLWEIVHDDNNRAVNGMKQALADAFEHMTMLGPSTPATGKPS